MMHLRYTNSCAAGLLFSVAMTIVNSAAAQTQPIEDLGALTTNGNSVAFDVSADGSVVVGNSSSTTGARAFRWDAAGGMVSLGVLAGGSSSYARDISSDGAVVVGYSGSASGTRAFRWDAAGGMVSLGILAGGSYSYAFSANSDGSVIVGHSTSSSGGRAFRWDAAGGMVSLGVLAGGGLSYAYGVSDDGARVVGYSGSTNGTRAFLWDATNGMVSLGTLVGGSSSNAYSISADGLVVVGESGSTNGQRAFRWDATNGMVSLGVLAGGSFSNAYGVNADGSVIVGYGNSTNGDRAYRWDATDGMVDLGVLAGGSSSRAYDVSADGSVVVGFSDSSSGTRAFIWRGVMLDLVNTQVAIGQSAADLAAAAESRNGAAVFSLERELEVTRAGSGAARARFGLGMPMAIRLEGALSGNQGVNSAGSGGLTAAFGLSENLTLGGFVLAGKEQTSYNTISQSALQTSYGLYLRSRQPNDQGLTWKLALAGSTGDADITREALLLNTEAGTGTAALATYAASFELGYGLNVNAYKLTPFLRVSVSQSQRDGYTEDAAITFPVTYDAYTETQAAATLGIDGTVEINANNELRFGGGLEIDISRSNSPITGSSDIPGMLTFDIAAPTVLNANRAYLSAGYSYIFNNSAELSLDITARQSAFTTTPTYGVAMGYTVRF